MSSLGSRSGFILTLSCPDTVGIVATVTTFIAGHGGLITEAAHFVDPHSSRSFMRTSFSGATLPDICVLRGAFASIADRFSMDWSLHADGRRCRVLIAVSKQGHCLNSMLHRWRIGTLPIDIIGVVSNHDTHQRLVEWHGLPFHHYPIGRNGRPEQEALILKLFEEEHADLLVLARYMQILSSDACEQLGRRCINIHHSFLPGFKGAKPYDQAYERGVKLIGATAHHVTPDLDEGPIIEQGVERVEHSMRPQDMIEIGHDLESTVLNRAVRWYAEHRLFNSGHRVVVLRS
ncbi:MAG: formyltetrahydrofolate deformylase [Gammaproteobacteria bacterium]|nr:formyltetrahydrofolate deformylase [Gammaproteobacteria bacterium]